ncbi:TonB-dependent receptor [Magnetospirillum sp. SS-4]|uniref:TonB-dependent receptor domain-containing protein n=1 Tax=Magnetospirillum sp. SS-4 TaxID=2681465 RepID=UPI001381DF45|nr:TonB-dependent receptor [Magnetospirillum sp. SS-4]CAA7616216.1 Outer membrane receptor protein [Magnetospirillum sp. SS-4]
MSRPRSAAILTAAIAFSSSASAQQAASAGPTLPAAAIVPELVQHAAPGPFPVLPMWDLGWAPTEMPYRRDKVHPGMGVLTSVMDSAAPVKLGTGYGNAGTAMEHFIQATVNHPLGMVRAIGNMDRARSFEDGNGDKVRTGYDRHTEQLMLAYRPSPDASLRMMLLHDQIDDHKLPLAASTIQGGVAVTEGYGADPVKTERTVGVVTAETRKPMSGIDRLKMEFRYSGLQRIANNFDLRPETAATSRNEARPARHEFGGSIQGESALRDDLLSRLTLSTKNVWHDAARFGGPNTSLSTLSGFQFPGVKMWESSANLDLAWKPAAPTNVNLGLRYDYVTAQATKADTITTVSGFTSTSRTLYRLYNGADTPVSRDDHLISVKLDGEHKMLGDSLSLTGSVGRIMRAADTRERYFALPAANNATAAGTSARQIGNPNLRPEVHYRAEAGAALKGEDWIDYGRKRPGGDDGLASRSWRISVSGYVDEIEDFISRDRAHGQPGILLNDNAFIWRNVDARMAGTDAELAVNLTRHWSTRLVVSYRWGENTLDSRALYGIDPLEGNWLVDYQDTLGEIGSWNAGFKLRAVASQTRVDADPKTGSGFDVASRGGFALLDLYGGVQLMDTVGLRIGVDNVLNKTYGEHRPLNATDDANPSAVNGPGRSFYARAVATF